MIILMVNHMELIRKSIKMSKNWCCWRKYVFHAIGYHIDENNTLEMKADWKWLYGELFSGEYRLVKEVVITKDNSYLGSKYVYVEFVI